MKTTLKRLAGVSILVVLAGCEQQRESAPETAASQEPENTAQVRDGKGYPARDFFETTSYSGASFSADGQRLLISSDQSGVFNAHEINISGSGNNKKLTESTDNASFAVSWFPGDDRFLYTFDQGGDELNHVLVQEESGKTVDLTPGENLKASFVGWSANKQSFFIVTNERDAKNFDLYRYSVDDYERELIFKNENGWGLSAVSRDGHWVALVKSPNNRKTDIYLWDGKNPEQPPKLLTDTAGDVSHGVYGFSPDSKTLYYSTDEFGEFTQAWVFDIDSGERNPAIEADWDVVFVGFSDSGRYRISGVNADARTEVDILDLETGTPLTLDHLPAGDISNISFSPDESQIAFYISSSVAPSNLYVMDIKTGEHKRLTQALNPKIDIADLVTAEVIRYKSFDGLEIPGILYKPKGASKDNPVPVLVDVHGGPGGQSRTGYDPETQHLVSHGYGILKANNRGSSGYGKSFYHMDDRRHGDVDLKDIVYARRYLESLDWVDGDHVGIIGGSYGGYMVAAALAFEPEVFDLGINIFGVTNWERTLKSIPPWWESFRESLYAEMGDPATDEERHRAISPLFHAKNITKPLLVVQGANDPRVLQVESDELVAAVRANNVPVEYVLFPDEGHGFLKRENRITASEAYLKFLNTHLGKSR